MAKHRAVDPLWRNMLLTWLAALAAGMASALLLFVAAALVSADASASIDRGRVESGPMPHPANAAGLQLASTDDGMVRPAPRLTSRVTMDINGMLARVRVEQRFRNPAVSWVEGVYIFPLPENAAVDRLRLIVGERVIEGEIAPRKAARKRFEQAKRAGQRASLLSQQRPNIFTASVANIGPGEEIHIAFEYQHELTYDQGRFSIRFPMVVAPRYIPGTPLGADRITRFGEHGWGVDTDQVPDATQITPPVSASEGATVNPTQIEIRLDPGFPVAELTSAYHQVAVEEREGRYRVSLQQDRVGADRDFELGWRPRVGKEPTAALFTERWEGDNHALLMLMPPTQAGEPAAVISREVVLVLDTSGSMHGESILQAKAALEMALRRLEPTDRFNLIQFNQRTEPLFERGLTATDGNLRRALDYVDGLEAEGGTEMLPALRRALDAGVEDGRLRQIVFLTDGSVGNEAALFELIRTRLGSSRLFTVGIGSAPNSHFMRRAAEFGRGSFTYIGSTKEVAERMEGLFRKLESPALTDLELRLPEGVQAIAYPSRIPDLYLGEPVVVALQWQGALDRVGLEGRFGAHKWQHQVDLLGGGREAPGIHALWARRAIAEFTVGEQEGVNAAGSRKKLEALALRHRLVSKYTSLVAIDKQPVRPGQAPLSTQTLPVALPHGWSSGQVFGHLPQTATAAGMNLLLGLLLLLASASLWILPKIGKSRLWCRDV